MCLIQTEIGPTSLSKTPKWSVNMMDSSTLQQLQFFWHIPFDCFPQRRLSFTFPYPTFSIGFTGRLNDRKCKGCHNPFILRTMFIFLNVTETHSLIQPTTFSSLQNQFSPSALPTWEVFVTKCLLSKETAHFWPKIWFAVVSFWGGYIVHVVHYTVCTV